VGVRKCMSLAVGEGAVVGLAQIEEVAYMALL